MNINKFSLFCGFTNNWWLKISDGKLSNGKLGNLSIISIPSNNISDFIPASYIFLLAKYSQEVKVFIFNQDTDILLVSETHFTNKSYRNPGYTLYHIMHPDGKIHGETALIIRGSIKHYEIDKYQRDFLQATSVTVEA